MISGSELSEQYERFLCTSYVSEVLFLGIPPASYISFAMNFAPRGPNIHHHFQQILLILVMLH